jgi:hypothetical protein
MALDLDRYDYTPGSQTLIRATEGTIAPRIPPRLRIRENAELEFPHIMVLIDDKKRSVIEPLSQQKSSFTKIYDSDLGFGLGHIAGYAIDKAQAESVRASLSVLLDAQQSPKSGDPMLFAMGDGNHSFATAKALWQRIRETLTEQERKSHPARYALCEVVNIHDEGIKFEAIHRVAFNASWEAFEQACADMIKDGVVASFEPKDGAVRVDVVYQGKKRPLYLIDETYDIAPGSVDKLLARLSVKVAALEVDYIHGDAEIMALCRENNIGFLLPALSKSDLFDQVSRHGPLPRKAFSMGEADEKRCYLEGRIITRRV